MRPPFTPEGVRALSTEGAQRYCNALRSYLIRHVTENGGHLASNLGIVEISAALVRVMDLPRDKVIYDTGHQCYVHKILTGRGKEFPTLRKKGGLSGFPRREESVYDAFGTGHSGTGLSAALGFAKAARLKGEDSFAVAVIGDGSFSGGMVFEALNNISPHDRVIIILNDNGMSIGKSRGQLRTSLNKLRTPFYYRLKEDVGEFLNDLPLVGEGLESFAKKVKRAVKRQTLPGGNLFEELGLHYFGPACGNDLGRVEDLLREAKKRNGPSIIHLVTTKGKGHELAEEDPTGFHGISPKNECKGAGKSFSRMFGDAVTDLAREDKKIVCITSAMESGVGLDGFGEAFPSRLFDTGIAEEHAMTFAAGLAAAGMKPCFAVYSTFFQRCVDQFLHDVALQKLPVTVCLDRAGITGEDGATHHGLYDLNFLLPIPGIKIYAPASEKEMRRALEQSFSEKETPCVIRYPKGCAETKIAENFPLDGEIEKKDYESAAKSGIIVVSFGRITAEVLTAAERFARSGKAVSVVRFSMLKGFDPKGLEVFRGAEKILFVEEGMATGGFSHYLASLLRKAGLADGVILRTLAPDEKFIPHGSAAELLAECGLSADGIEKELYALDKIGSISV
ncbi:MAG: 1-deoxy-D-xylulose-5-phosphate synthase [Ruminococcaceae bacterium]|nr:1-deoxy-D-xylulose-5-phosphate synthase [Oscillospiraceae bacterium]